MRLCFATFARVLNFCRKKNIDIDIDFIGPLTQTIVPHNRYITDPTAVSKLINCKEDFKLGKEEAEKLTYAGVVQAFENKIIPMLHVDRKAWIIFALLDIIKNDYSIDNDNATTFKKYFGVNKSDLLGDQIEYILPNFLASVMLFTVIEIDNRDGKPYAKLINKDFFSRLTRECTKKFRWDNTFQKLVILGENDLPILSKEIKYITPKTNKNESSFLESKVATSFVNAKAAEAEAIEIEKKANMAEKKAWDVFHIAREKHLSRRFSNLYAYIEFNDGTIYGGEVKNEIMHGHGVRIRPDESRYAGEWRDGKRNGYGIYAKDNYSLAKKWGTHEKSYHAIIKGKKHSCPDCEYRGEIIEVLEMDIVEQRIGSVISRREVLPAETYNQPKLYIRWLRSGTTTGTSGRVEFCNIILGNVARWVFLKENYPDVPMGGGSLADDPVGVIKLRASGGEKADTAVIIRAHGSYLKSTTTTKHMSLSHDGWLRTWAWVADDNYIYLEADTTGHEDIVLEYDIRASSDSSPHFLQLQYSLDGRNWSNIFLNTDDDTAKHYIHGFGICKSRIRGESFAGDWKRDKVDGYSTQFIRGEEHRKGLWEKDNPVQMVE